ncbi:MAG: RNA-binding transcriptional accessory protein, partial [Specibacter sp.]
VKSGQVVRVKVLEVEPERKRISLTLRLDDAAESSARPGHDAGARPPASRAAGRPAPKQPAPKQPASKQPVADSRGARQNGRQGGGQGAREQRSDSGGRPATAQPSANTAMAEALRRAGLGK